MIKHVLIADTHGRNDLLDGLPDGDVLIHCGDSTKYGSRVGLFAFCKAFGVLPHKDKILIAGNHDGCFIKHPEEAPAIVRDAGIHYLQDEGITLNGLNYWGIPWVPQFGEWAFMGDEVFLRNKWASIPLGVNVLISHGPPKWILDDGVGSISQYTFVNSLAPELNVFGHIHEGYGLKHIKRTAFINCSLLNLRYESVNAPVVFDLPAI